MNAPTPLSISQRSELARFSRWIFSRQGLRRLLIVLAWTATAIVLLYGEENWRGRRAWNQKRQEMEARGAQLELKEFIPNPIPDEQNFAAIPFVQAWFPKDTSGGSDNRWGDNFVFLDTKVAAPKAKGKRAGRQFIDLAGWETALAALRSGSLDTNQRFESNKLDAESRAKAAPAVLEGFRTNDVILAEFRAASRRPQCRYPLVYNLENPWGILLPHLANIKAICQRLQLRACAELAAGQSERALADVELIFRLADSPKDEPFLISYLVRIACVQIALQPVWEGLAEHRWPDAALQTLQRRLQECDFIGELKRPLEGERAAGLLTADLLYRQKYHLSDLLDSPGSLSFDSTIANLFGRIAPHGWFYLEQVHFCSLWEQQLGGTFDTKEKRVFPSLAKQHARDLEQEISGGRQGKTLKAVLRHQLMATLLLPSLEKFSFKAAAGKAATDQASLACALERYRLAHGQFPEKLEDLTPQFIAPLLLDPITGTPYKYHRDQEKGFILYSIGWDEKDDGGVPGKTLYDEKEGDWVWETTPARAGKSE